MGYWNPIESEEQLKTIAGASSTRPQLIFKHSTRCGISTQAHDRLLDASEGLAEGIDLHYLDLLNYRPISNQIADLFGVPHQSPQVIILRDGKAIYSSSHSAINPVKILENVSQ